MPRLFSLAVLLLAVLALPGCGGGDPHGRQELVGNISFKGRPLDQGVIDFVPVEPKDAAGTRGMIQNGTFRIPAHQGLTPGRYLMKISSPEADTTSPPGGPPGMPMPPLGKERIPAKFNRDSKVTVEVKSTGENRFDSVIE